MTCLSALEGGGQGSIDAAVNRSKGCGGVMRMAPVGLLSSGDPFRFGCELAAITHGHPTGWLAAGAFALLVASLVDGAPLEASLDTVLARLAEEPDSGECLGALGAARSAASTGAATPERVESLGGGWVAEEALGIAVYAALTSRDDFEVGVLTAVNHSGDSDSTAAIAGNVLGALLGREAVPTRWLERLELREVIETVAEDLLAARSGTLVWSGRYPLG
jgi:ADP-ribosylglycohydrolase